MGIALTIFIAPFPDLLDEQINFTKLLNGHLNVIKTIKFNLKKIHKNALMKNMTKYLIVIRILTNPLGVIYKRDQTICFDDLFWYR